MFFVCGNLLLDGVGGGEVRGGGGGLKEVEEEFG